MLVVIEPLTTAGVSAYITIDPLPNIDSTTTLSYIVGWLVSTTSDNDDDCSQVLVLLVITIVLLLLVLPLLVLLCMLYDGQRQCTHSLPNTE